YRPLIAARPSKACRGVFSSWPGGKTEVHPGHPNPHPLADIQRKSWRHRWNFQIGERDAPRAEVHVVAFREHGPIARELILQPTTDYPAPAGRARAAFCEPGHGVGDGFVLPLPSRAAFHVGEQIRLNGVADAARCGSEPGNAGGQKIASGTQVGAFDPGAFEHSLCAEHPCADLIITANLPATDHTTGRV